MVGEITKLMLEGNQKGLSLLYDNYSGAILGIVKGIIKQQEHAEEVLQQTFLKAWENIDKFNSDYGTLFTWLAAIARNSAIDQVRLKSFQNQKNTDSLDNQVDHVEGSQTNTSKIDTDRLLEKLEDKNRDVLELVYLQGHSHSSVAKLMNIPLGTVKSRLRISINQLRKELQGEKGLFMGSILFLILLTLLSWA